MSSFSDPSGDAVTQTSIDALATYNISPAIRTGFAQYLAGDDQRALYHFNPAYFAEQLGLSRRRAIEVLALGLQTGLVGLNWEVECPDCGGRSEAFAGLRQAHSEMYCVGCDLTYHAHLDDEIHITFTVSERLRQLGPEANDGRWRREVDKRLGPVSSHELLTVQLFRDLLVNEPLPAGESFQIKWAALMFTDLGGSTALYARKGDPRAYSLVREHFNIIFGAVDASGGAVVKTIGDAVMAVFPGGEEALRAARESQRRIERFNEERGLGDDERLRLKIGVHAGPALAVTLNERLDYFGTVVNAAARVQGLAAHGETVITRQVLDNVESGELLESATPGEMLVLRGLDDQPFEIIRVRE